MPLLATDCLHECELIHAYYTHRSFSLCSGNAVDGAKMIGASNKVCGWLLGGCQLFVCCVCVFDLCGPLGLDFLADVGGEKISPWLGGDVLCNVFSGLIEIGRGNQPRLG